MFFKKSGDLEESKALGKGEVHVAHYIPQGVHLTPNVIKLRENGDLCATWRLHGIPFETARTTMSPMALSFWSVPWTV